MCSRKSISCTVNAKLNYRLTNSEYNLRGLLHVDASWDSTAGFYLTQFFLSKSVPLLVFIWLVAVLDDPERTLGLSLRG